MLSRKAVLEYQAAYRKVYGKEISYGEALEQGIKLLKLMRLIYKPLSKEELDKFQKEDKKDK